MGKSNWVSLEDEIKDYENILIFLYKNKDRFKNGDSKDKELGEREFKDLVKSLSKDHTKVCQTILENLKDYKEDLISNCIKTIEESLWAYYFFNVNSAKNSSDRKKIIRAMLNSCIETKSLIFFKRTEKFDELMNCLNDASFSNLLEEIGNEEFLKEEDMVDILRLLRVDEDKGAASMEYDSKGIYKAYLIQDLDITMKTQVLLIGNGLEKIEDLTEIMESENGDEYLRDIGLNDQDIKALGNQLEKLGLCNSIKEKQETLGDLKKEEELQNNKSNIK